MSIWLRFVLAVLATWRVTHLLASEDGPADLLFRLRARLGSSVVGKLMDCFYCLSLWIAAPLAMLVTRDVSEWFLSWLAVSGGACLLQRMTQEPVVIRHLNPDGETPDAMLRPEERESEEQHFSERRHPSAPEYLADSTTKAR